MKMQISIASSTSTNKTEGVALSAGRGRGRYSDAKVTNADRAKLKAEMEKLLKRIVPSAVKAGVTEKWAKSYVTEWYAEQRDGLNDQFISIQEALKALQGLTIRDCVAEFKNEMALAKKTKEKADAKSTVRALVLKKLDLTAAEFKVFCQIVRDEK